MTSTVSRHRWAFHNINVICCQELCCCTRSMGSGIILLQYCHAITCKHEWQNHWYKKIISVVLSIKISVLHSIRVEILSVCYPISFESNFRLQGVHGGSRKFFKSVFELIQNSCKIIISSGKLFHGFIILN